ncbi:transmembrane protein 245-like isoform X2 [Tubulanus polymorphus]|uniref:transmembrane protein 245-like isoform X2 n=1 Tax=Tubulanus polymorphus TaxID=672921 RepID=UPI003DA2D5AC
MASPTYEYLRSPFSNVFQILPEGHDKALKQAFYNTAALLFVIIVGGAVVAVYFVLHPFIQPLLWAVLCGTFLHPFKNTLTGVVKTWLQGLKGRRTPLVVGTALIPVQIVDRVTERIGSAIFNNLKLIGVLSIGLPTVYILYYFGPLQTIFHGFQAFGYFLYQLVGYFSTIWVLTLIIGYVLIVIFYWTPKSSPILKYLAVPVWIAAMLQIAGLAGPLRVPLFIAVISMLVIGCIASIREARRKQVPGQPPISAWAIITGDSTSATTPTSEDEDAVAPSTSANENNDSTLKDTTTDATGGENKNKESSSSKKKTTMKAKKMRTLSDSCFIALFWALILVRIWIHFWVIKLLPILLAILFIKKLVHHVLDLYASRSGSQIGGWEFLKQRLDICYKMLQDWAGERKEAICPAPVRGFTRMVITGDRKIVSFLEDSMDAVMSIAVILIVLFGSITFCLFMVVQTNHESMHLVTVTSNVLNKTLHPELSQWFPKGEELEKALDSMVNNAYIHGREWITSKVHQLLNGDKHKNNEDAEKLQKQVLQIWDKLYHLWLARGNSATANLVMSTRPDVFRSPLAMTNWTGIFDLVQSTGLFKYTDIMAFCQENIGVFMSVLESIWVVLSGNISLVINIATAILSVVFGGGTAILNFVISSIVFMTALFYLLASSGEQYKPIAWVMSLSPGGGGKSGFGLAVEKAISGVFMASFKMATFYGLYTWLTHTIFGIQIVFIPSALAAMFAAVPFLGTYWAALPAVIELGLVHGDWLMALLLLLCHFLPMSVVDTAIYSDIKGGGHPYLTGLSIAGGMYCLGLEGAVFGPILLCCLIVLVNYYGMMMKQETSASDVRPRAVDRKVQFNLQSDAGSSNNCNSGGSDGNNGSNDPAVVTAEPASAEANSTFS